MSDNRRRQDKDRKGKGTESCKMAGTKEYEGRVEVLGASKLL